MRNQRIGYFFFGSEERLRFFYAYFSLFFFIACFFLIFARDLVIFIFSPGVLFRALTPHPVLFSMQPVFHGVGKG